MIMKSSITLGHDDHNVSRSSLLLYKIDIIQIPLLHVCLLFKWLIDQNLSRY